MSSNYGQAYRFNHPDINVPEYCSCRPPWQTREGPLKDGSHYHDCVAAEVAEDMAVLVRDRDRWRDRAETAERLVALARRVAELPAAGHGERYEATRDLREALKALDDDADPPTAESRPETFSDMAPGWRL